MVEYRYTLRRSWQRDDGHLGTACWVMLNPSTADDVKNDQTITKIVTISQRHEFSDLVVVNLFAARSTVPTHLVEMGFAGAVGPGNKAALDAAFSEADAIVLAWGVNVVLLDKMAHRDYAWRVVERARNSARRRLIPVLCCGRTKDGHPKHPCRLPNDTKLVPW